MSEESARYIRVDEWVFEIKTVRALRVDEYGKPYSAIANCSFNGDTMYVDGLLKREEQELSKEDVLAFYKFCKKMNISDMSYHRYQNGESVTKELKIESLDKKPTPPVDAKMRLVT